jgi:hypothetical protein
VNKLELLVKINEAPCPGRIRFNSLAKFYLKADFGADAVRPKSENTTAITEHIVRDYLVARWGEEIAEDIKAEMITPAEGSTGSCPNGRRVPTDTTTYLAGRA